MASIQAVNVTRRFSPSAPLSQRTRYRQELVAGYSEQENGSDVEPQTGEVLALDRASLLVKDGESMVILGSSGCGKSTLLRCVAGLETYEGDIFYGDQDMRDVPPKDRGIGIVFQNYALYPQFESKGNLSFLSCTSANRRLMSASSSRRRSWAWASMNYWIASRRRCRAGRSSVSPSPAPSAATRNCCCSTSR
jgi:ABC-type multidrug transport system ATPase subunit